MKGSRFFIIAGLVFLAGCVAVRTYTVEKPRVDREISGNRGYLTGSPSESAEKESRLGDTRKVSVLEIEFGESVKTESLDSKTVDQSFVSKDTDKGSSLFYDDDDSVYVKEISLKEGEEEFEYYVVQKDDTLQKISQKFYGTTAKWKYIFNANKTTLKNPDRVYPGMKIKIPSL